MSKFYSELVVDVVEGAAKLGTIQSQLLTEASYFTPVIMPAGVTTDKSRRYFS